MDLKVLAAIFHEQLLISTIFRLTLKQGQPFQKKKSADEGN